MRQPKIHEKKVFCRTPWNRQSRCRVLVLFVNQVHTRYYSPNTSDRAQRKRLHVVPERLGAAWATVPRCWALCSACWKDGSPSNWCYNHVRYYCYNCWRKTTTCHGNSLFLEDYSYVSNDKQPEYYCMTVALHIRKEHWEIWALFRSNPRWIRITWFIRRY